MKHFLKIFGINIAIMVILVAVMITGLSVWLKSYTHHAEAIKVPSVVGLLDDEAIYYLEEAGLKPMIIDSIYSDAKPGAVIEQLPEADIPVKKGRIIYLTINAKTIRMMTMPDVLEFSSRQAKSLLREAGFIVEKVEEKAYDFDDLVLDAKIDGKSIVPGAQYPYHSRVTIVVGSTQIELTPENDETENVWFE